MKLTLLVTVVTCLHFVIATDPTQSTILTTTSGRSRFSWLLHQNANSLRSTSISTERREKLPNSVGNHIFEPPEANVHPTAPALLPRASKRPPFTQQIISTPEQDDEYLYIRTDHVQKSSQYVDDNASVADINNSKPAPHRVQLNVLRKSMRGRGVNFAPMFSQEETKPTPHFVSLEEPNSEGGKIKPYKDN